MVSRNIDTHHRPLGRLGSYELLHTLSVGGFGKVFLGEYIHLHSRAAVKVLHAPLVYHDLEPENILLGSKSEVLIGDLNNQSVRFKKTANGRRFILGAVRKLDEDRLSTNKMHHVFLIELANRMHFDKQSTPLHRAFLKLCQKHAFLVSLAYKRIKELVDKQSTPLHRAFLKLCQKHAFLVSLAYKRIKELECAKEHLEAT